MNQIMILLFDVDLRQSLGLSITVGLLSWIYLGFIAGKMYSLASKIKTGGEMQYLAAIACWIVVIVRPLVFGVEMANLQQGGRDGLHFLISAGINVLFAIIGTIGYFWIRRSEQDYQTAESVKQQSTVEAYRLAQAEERRALENRFRMFSKNEDYQYVRQFAKKYGERFDRKNLEKLQRVVSENWNFSIDQVHELVDAEIYALEIERLAVRLDASADRSLNGIIRQYLSYYGSADASNTLLLHQYLARKGMVESDSDQMFGRIQHVAAEIESERFKQQLLDESSIISADLDSLSGYQFESFLKELFIKMGYQVEQTRLSGDQGADLVVVKLGERTVIQAKRFIAAVGNKAVQEIVAAMSLYQAPKGMVVTNSRFTPAAYELARANNIQLIDGSELREFIGNYW